MNTKRLIPQMIILIMLALSACGKAQPAPSEVPVIPTPAGPYVSPSARYYVSMAYDAESDKMILFGGGFSSDPFLVNDETWAYDATTNTWTQMKPASSPSGRSAASMVYDSKADRVIMFGGANPDVIGLDDTWAYNYNTNTWTEKAKGPTKHLGAQIAYDSESDRVILFGGYSMDGRMFDDTWAYDYNTDTWTDMKPSPKPSGRNYHAMAYDSKSDRVIMWGGDPSDEENSVWAYDFNHNSWEKRVSGVTPLPRYYHSMVYDTVADRTIMFGSITHADVATWVYDYNTDAWTKLEPPTNPDMVRTFAMAYSTAVDRVIIFGGESNYVLSAKTWSYDLNANAWTELSWQP